MNSEAFRPPAHNIAVVTQNFGFPLKHLNRGGFPGLGVANEDDAPTIDDRSAGMEEATLAISQNPG